MTEFEKITAKLKGSGQEHLLQFWDNLNTDSQRQLLSELELLDCQESSALFLRAMDSSNSLTLKLDDKMQPVPAGRFGSESSASEEMIEEYRMEGFKAVSEGKVCVLLMAGGQGTRLGVSYPKGMYPICPVSQKTLFQVQAERIQTLMHLAKEKTGKQGSIPWYIMTSGPTSKETTDFFIKNNYFGLDPSNVKLFEQNSLPCFDFQGKIFLDEKHHVSRSPDGNGGLYQAIRDQKILDDMIHRNLRYVHVHSVDNILVKVADPVFIGYCAKKEADCAAKVVRKADPFEPVGVVCLVDNRFQVVEYSEITEATARLKDEQDNLVYAAGNICNHLFTVNFLNKIVNNHLDELKLHIAKKKIPYINKNGEKVIPSSPNGIKIEKFIFDVFQFAENFVLWEVPRTSEFSALKNADDAGKDCPSTAKKDLCNLHRVYVENAGGRVDGPLIEISPLVSYAGENLKDICSGREFKTPYEIS